jgi:hypothetical protein
MDTSAKMKEEIIRSYISKINIKNGSLSVQAIKEDLRRLIKEVPGIQIGWKDTKSVNEKTGMSDVVSTVTTITVAFSDGEDTKGNPRVHSVVYYI